MKNRADRIVLDGEWQFAFSRTPPARPCASLDELKAAGLPLMPATVPGNVELDLQRHGIIPDPLLGMNVLELRDYERVHFWYGRRFQAGERAGHDAFLVLEGVDCYAEIYLNGEHLGSTDNMLIEHRFSLAGRLRADNELLVHLRPIWDEASRHAYPVQVTAMPLHLESLYVRKAPHMFGWDIMPRALSGGLWRPVRVEYRPQDRIDEIYLETVQLAPDHSWANLRLSYHVRMMESPPDDLYEIELAGHCGNSSFCERRKVHFDVNRIRFRFDCPRLWWPCGFGAPDLYDVTVTLFRRGVPVDTRAFRHGIRTFTFQRSSITTPENPGAFLFRVNGEKLFIRGSNWVSADPFHSRDVVRIPGMLDLAEDLGCNMLRCWGGNVYENDLFFELCDEKGIFIWQDFSMSVAAYPQDEAFARRLDTEARQVVRRLRQHACLALWCGDNECDGIWLLNRRGDPNRNRLTREVLPRVVYEEDPQRPFMPSSPCYDPEAARLQADAEYLGQYLPEGHFYPRAYYKPETVLKFLRPCMFAGEIGYLGCPSVSTLRRFLSPAKVWPWQNNPEWILHSTNPTVDATMGGDNRIRALADQIRETFGSVPETLDDYVFASQAAQAEAYKFFIEFFRAGKWAKTGILWWNLIDGWPQFSDAVVDYYFGKKLAYHFIKRVQQPVMVLLTEPEGGLQRVILANDTRCPVEIEYTVTDADSGVCVAGGSGQASANSHAELGQTTFTATPARFYLIAWQGPVHSGRNHALAGNPPFDLTRYRAWVAQTGIEAGS